MIYSRVRVHTDRHTQAHRYTDTHTQCTHARVLDTSEGFSFYC